MKRYKDYMDGVEASDTLHQKLTELESPRKRPAAWKKYGAAAAALVLAAGVGAWGLSRGGWDAIVDHFEPAAEVKPEIPAPEIADVPALYPDPDIALEDPNGRPFVDPIPPGNRTGGGYEVVYGEGSDAMVAYFLLPALNWADASALTQGSMDYQLAPSSAVSRDATWDDVQLFAGGEKAMRDHLLWEGLTWGGTLWFSEDGTPCAASLYADGNGVGLFLEVMKGSEVPSCIVFPEEYYETSQWQGVKFTALKNSGYLVTENSVELNEKREISLYANGTGYKLTLYDVDDGWADEVCARFVRYAVDGGFQLDALSDEPIYEEDMPKEDGGPGYIEPIPALPDATPQTTPYNPNVMTEAKAPTPPN